MRRIKDSPLQKSDRKVMETTTLLDGHINKAGQSVNNQNVISTELHLLLKLSD